MDVSKAQARADALREESERDALSGTFFEGLAAQLSDPKTPLALQTQLLRILGNACIDHDTNRTHAVDAKLPQIALKLVGASLSQQQKDETVQAFLRAAAGSLLNLIMDHPGAQVAFTQSGGLPILLSAIDPSSSSCLYSINAASKNPSLSQNDLEVAAMTQLWFLRILEELHQAKSHQAAFEAESLDLMPLPAFVLSSQSYFTNDTSAQAQDVSEDLVELESNGLVVAASLFEALSMDMDVLAIKISQSPSTLLKLFDYVESEQTPALWKSSEALIKNWSMIKAAASKGLIAAVSMDDVMQHCMESDGPAAKSWVIDRCLAWLSSNDHRNDLKINASVMLANLARSDDNCLAFVQHFQLMPVLFKLLEAHVDIESKSSKKGESMQLLHGVLSLLKHLAIPAANKPIIGAAGPYKACVAALQTSFDMAQPVQVASIGLLKHLVTSCPPNAASFLAELSSLESLLEISGRTDDARLKNESTRILVQLIRTLWMSNDAAHIQIRQRLLTRDVLVRLMEMVKSSAKWPILINEGIVSLALLSAAAAGPAVSDGATSEDSSMRKSLNVVMAQDNDFLTTIAGLLGPEPARKASTSSLVSSGSNEGTTTAEGGAKKPIALPTETKLNILTLLQVLSGALEGEDKSRLGAAARPVLQQIREAKPEESAAGLRDKAEQLWETL